jgi:hypothetical protein
MSRKHKTRNHLQSSQVSSLKPDLNPKFSSSSRHTLLREAAQGPTCLPFRARRLACRAQHPTSIL